MPLTVSPLDTFLPGTYAWALLVAGSMAVVWLLGRMTRGRRFRHRRDTQTQRVVAGLLVAVLCTGLVLSLWWALATLKHSPISPYHEPKDIEREQYENRTTHAGPRGQ